jgi:hypothetical protein
MQSLPISDQADVVDDIVDVENPTSPLGSLAAAMVADALPPEVHADLEVVRQLVVVALAPSPDWCEPIRFALAKTFSDRPFATSVARAPRVLDVGLERHVLTAVATGRSVVLVTPELSWAPEGAVAVADAVVKVRPPSPAIVAGVIEAFCGTRPAPIPDDVVLDVPPLVLPPPSARAAPPTRSSPASPGRVGPSPRPVADRCLGWRS